MRVSFNNSSAEPCNMPLSQLLKAYMDKNGLSRLSVSKILSIDKKTVNEILDGNASLKLNYALRIMDLLGLSNGQLIESYLNEVQENELAILEQTRMASFIMRHFDISGLKEARVIRSTSDFNEMAQAICHFFGYESVYEYDGTTPEGTSLFSKSRFVVAEEKEQKMQRFWITCARESFLRINNPNEYDGSLLNEFIKRIAPLTRDVNNGFGKALYVLYRIGITVIVQPYIPKTKAYGITMMVNGKPCIVITDLGKKYHRLWMTLLHELYHVINDSEYLARVYFHVSDSETEDLFVSERDADLFSRRVILPDRHFEIARKLIHNTYKIKDMAGICNIDSSMIYGLYLESLGKEEASTEYRKYSSFLRPSDPSIKNIIFDPVNRNGIVEEVDRIRKQYQLLIA